VWENDPENGAYSSSTEKDEDEIYRIAFQEGTLHDHTEGWKDGSYSVRMTRAITVLSENDEQETFATKYPNAKDKPHAFLERTLWKDGYFNTLCLPFAVKSIAASPLAGAEVFAFTGGEVSGTQGNEVLQLLLSKITNDRLEAGVPYLLRWPNDATLFSTLYFYDVENWVTKTTPDVIDGDIVYHGFYPKTHITGDTSPAAAHYNFFLGAEDKITGLRTAETTMRR
jgi:hypothetical protein